jgi:hypothetical protein
VKILTLKKSGKDFYSNVVNIIPATGLTGKNRKYSKPIELNFVMHPGRFLNTKVVFVIFMISNE